MLRPLITEKSLKAVESLNEYTFVVEKASGKHELRKIIEETLKVKVESLRTKPSRTQKKRSGKKGLQTQGSDKKHVIVRLDKKDKISLFEIKEQK